MRSAIRVLALAAIGAAAFVPAAHAQDMTTATFNGTTIWVGGGVQFLSLPDIRFVGQGSSPTDMHRQKNSESDWSDFGGATGGGIETALGMWGAARVSGSVKGFWSNVETDDRSTCSRPDMLRLRSRRQHVRLRAADSCHPHEPRCRLLGRPGRAEIRHRAADRGQTDDLPQRLFYRRLRRSRD